MNKFDLIVIGAGQGGLPAAALAARLEVNVALIEMKVNYRVVPRAVFTQSALASVGLTEAEATVAGHEVKIGIAYFEHSGRAKAIGEYVAGKCDRRLPGNQEAGR